MRELFTRIKKNLAPVTEPLGKFFVSKRMTTLSKAIIVVGALIGGSALLIGPSPVAIALGAAGFIMGSAGLGMTGVAMIKKSIIKRQPIFRLNKKKEVLRSRNESLVSLKTVLDANELDEKEKAKYKDPNKLEQVKSARKLLNHLLYVSSKQEDLISQAISRVTNKDPSFNMDAFDKEYFDLETKCSENHKKLRDEMDEINKIDNEESSSITRTKKNEPSLNQTPTVDQTSNISTSSSLHRGQENHLNVLPPKGNVSKLVKKFQGDNEKFKSSKLKMKTT